MFHADFETARISRGDHVNIVGRVFEGQQNLLIVDREKAGRTSINLNDLKRHGRDKFTAYDRHEDGQLYAGGPMVWERTDKERGFFVGERFTPIGSAAGRIEIEVPTRDAGGKEVPRRIWLDDQDPQLKFIGPGHVITTHRAQGMSIKERVIGMLHSANANAALAYVQVSRAVSDLVIITNDVELLISKLGREDGMKLIAWENVRALKDAAAALAPKTLENAPPKPLEKPKDDHQQKQDPFSQSQMEKAFERDRPLKSEHQLEEQRHIERSHIARGRSK